MDWNAIVALVVAAWFLIGAIHAVMNWMSFNAYVRNWVWDEANKESLPKNISFPRCALNREILRNSEGLQLQDAVFTLILGPIGIAVVGFDWLVRWLVKNWPECLVIGGHPKEDERFSNLCEKTWVFWTVGVVAMLATDWNPVKSAIIAACWLGFWGIYNLRLPKPEPAPITPVTATNNDVNLESYRQKAGLSAEASAKAGIFNNK